jgi:drug/metabolite transporter (DMT)-like permease
VSPLLATLLYGLATLLLLGASIYLWIRERETAAARWFVGTCLSLLGWTVTLYVFQHSFVPTQVLLIGRLNFAAASLAVYAVYRLVRAVATLPKRPVEQALGWVTVLIALVSAATPWVDEAETVSLVAGQSHQTTYGALFPLYVLHVVLLLGGAILLAFRERRVGEHPQHVRDQLLLLGVGILGTGAVSITTNVLIPYTTGDFRWIDIGRFFELITVSS